MSLRIWLFSAVSAWLLLGCDAGGVGDPCIPEDEYRQDFPGYSIKEVNVESRSFQCQTRVCLVANFQGRVSCPLGQGQSTAAASLSDRQTAVDQVNQNASDPNLATAQANAKGCLIPGTSLTAETNLVTVQVQAQLDGRRPADAVYCSCRCANAQGKKDDGAKYCECPENYACTPLIKDIGLGNAQLSGSYCVKKNKVYQEGAQGSKCTDLKTCPP